MRAFKNTIETKAQALANAAAHRAAARNFDFAALDEKIKRMEKALRTIHQFGEYAAQSVAWGALKDISE